MPDSPVEPFQGAPGRIPRFALPAGHRDGAALTLGPFAPALTLGPFGPRTVPVSFRESPGPPGSTRFGGLAPADRVSRCERGAPGRQDGRVGATDPPSAPNGRL